ncbi:hypothetical protein [Paenibacillus thiaminolyticus]|uniref:hypothetical protein n=1 Tax=Paenibacillus thiaminolyticus TaxID=49283 RepID=UPI0030B947CB
MPQEVTSKLQGQKFNSFDDFREAFWKEVASSSYASEFGTSNNTRMKKRSCTYCTSVSMEW